MQINQPDCGVECIHSVLIVKMMTLAKKAVVHLDDKLITPNPRRDRIGQKAGFVLLGVGGLYFLISILIWWAKG
jgi:hypothetical protein